MLIPFAATIGILVSPCTLSSLTAQASRPLPRTLPNARIIIPRRNRQGPPAHQASAYAAITQSGSSADVVRSCGSRMRTYRLLAAALGSVSNSGAEALTAPRDRRNGSNASSNPGECACVGALDDRDTGIEHLTSARTT